MIGTGCSSILTGPEQSIDISSQPSGAAVFIGEEYIGDTPITHHIKDVNQDGSLVIKIEKLGYEAEMKRLEKKNGSWFSSGEFPKKQHFVLQRRYPPREGEVLQEEE
jgi:hypothetical protein